MTTFCANLITAAGAGEPGAKERLLALLAPLRHAVAQRTLSRRYPLWEVGDAEQVACIETLRLATRDVVALPAFFAIAMRRACLRERCLYHEGFVLPREPVETPPALDPKEPAEDCATVPAAEDAALQTIEADSLRAAVNKLPPPLWLVIVRRFGLDGREPATLHQIASEAGIDFRRVSERERRACSLLRAMLSGEK